MIRRENLPKRYFFQWTDIKEIKDDPDNPETIGDERKSTCNSCMPAMIINWDCNKVLNYFIENKIARRDEKNIINLIRKVTGIGPVRITEWADKPRAPKPAEFQAMRSAIDGGKVIAYHMYGHYYVIIGYILDGDSDYQYIAYDSAGDRNLPLRNRTHDSGKGVIYSEQKLINEKIYGSCWACELA